jgi:hypothetical protein
MAPRATAKIRAFWTWFKAGPGTWGRKEDDDDHLLELFDGIGKFFPELTPTTLSGAGGPFELVFSLWNTHDEEARKRAAPLIDVLTASAPKLKNWRFKAYGDPVGWMNAYFPRLELPNGSKLVVDAMRFDVLQRRPLALRVYVPGYTKRKAAAFRIAVRRVLEAGMGERFVVKDLRRLEVAGVKRIPGKAKPIRELSNRSALRRPTVSSARSFAIRSAPPR